MKVRYFFVVVLSLFLIMNACAAVQTEETSQAASIKTTEKKEIDNAIVAPKPQSTPSIKIVLPKDGDLIKGSNVAVELKEENFEIVAIGQNVKEGEGHFHVWLGSEKRITTERLVTFENVISGKYAIVAELVKSDHSSLSSRVTATITVNVQSDFVPKVEATQEGVKEFTVESDDNGFYPNRLKAKVGEKIRINFKFRDSSIYFAGIDIKGPFEDINYKLKGQQPVTREFTMLEETRITSFWPSSGVKKATLIVEVEK